jgi:hypothetical protein
VSCYSFKIKKGKFELSVNSEDRYFVLMQFNRLFEQFAGKLNPTKLNKQDLQEKPEKPKKPEKEEKTAKKPKSKKAKQDEYPETEAEPKAEIKPEVKLPETEPTEAIAMPEPKKVAEKAPEKTEPKQTVMPLEIKQEPQTAEIEETVEELPDIKNEAEIKDETEAAIKAVDEDESETAVEEAASAATAGEAPAAEEPAEIEEASPEEDIIVSAATVKEEKEPPVIEEETEDLLPEENTVTVLAPEEEEEVMSEEADKPEITNTDPSDDEISKEESDDAFARIMAIKMQEDPEPTDDEEPVTEEGDEEDIEDEEEAKETITYYEDEEDIPGAENAPVDEESELADALNKSFQEEEPVVETKKNKIYDILQQKLASLPKAELSRLNLFKPKAQSLEHEPEIAKPESLPSFKSFDDLIYLKKPQTKLDYLLVTAYYLQESEAKDKYSLKQINARVIPILKEAIDHSVIHEAVAHSYLLVMPDLSEGAGVTEYAISTEGIEYILNEL